MSRELMSVLRIEYERLKHIAWLFNYYIQHIKHIHGQGETRACIIQREANVEKAKRASSQGARSSMWSRAFSSPRSNLAT